MPSGKLTVSRILLLHYLLFGYVFVQFIWWAFLIYDLNSDLIEQQVVIDNLRQSIQADEVGTFNPFSINQKFFMILGEGSVFLSILLLGGYYIRKFILREGKLAKQERNFLLATTHELNSPIAAVKLNVQTLLKRELPPDKTRKLLENTLHSTQRLESLSGNILLASRLDAQKLSAHCEWHNVKALLSKIVAQFEAIRKAGQTIDLIVGESHEIYTDKPILESIVGNLLSNAVKYSPEGSVIKVKADISGKLAIIMVSDQGKGVPPDERQHIFKKFYRIENEETRSSKGTGLGLYLVANLVKLLGGTIKVKPNLPSGTIFEITLPQKQNGQ